MGSGKGHPLNRACCPYLYRVLAPLALRGISILGIEGSLVFHLFDPVFSPMENLLDGGQGGGFAINP